MWRSPKSAGPAAEDSSPDAAGPLPHSRAADDASVNRAPACASHPGCDDPRVVEARPGRPVSRAGAPEAVMTALSDAFARMTEDGHLRPCDPQVAAEHFAFLIMGADLDRGTFTGERALAARVRERALLGANAFLRAYAPDVRDGA